MIALVVFLALNMYVSCLPTTFAYESTPKQSYSESDLDVSVTNSALQIQPCIIRNGQTLTNGPIARDLIQHVTRMDVHVSIHRPASVKGIGYGLCHPAYEEMPFITELDKWLACVPILTDMSLTIESHVLWTNGNRLGINWPWLLRLLDPLKQKHKALKYIELDDKRNMSNSEGLCWTYKDATTGIWSELREMGPMELSWADHGDDLLRAKMHLR
jgi:hypothetical protein